MAINQMTYIEFKDWLPNQPNNTVDTPYEVIITDIGAYLKLSSLSGSVGYVLRQNPTKYVDLSKSVIPDYIVNLSGNFSSCSNLVAFPEIPNSVVSLESCFLDCSSLKISPNIPSSVTSLRECFRGCTSLTIAPNIPSSVTNMSTCFYGCTSLTTWKQRDSLNNSLYYPSAFYNCTNLQTIYTDKQVSLKSFLNTLYTASTNNFPTDPDTLNFYTYDYPNASEVPFSELDSFLQELLDNTPQTPYKIKVTELTANDIGNYQTNGTLGYVLNQNNTKHVDLSVTELPEITALTSTFRNCINLVKAPNVPNTVINMSNTFRGSSIIETPLLSNNVESMYATFAECHSLVNVTNLPDSIKIMSNVFWGCTSLTRAPVLPKNVTDLTGCFLGTQITESPVIPITVTKIGETFKGTNIETAPIIPNNVKSMSRTFENCEYLKIVPIVPRGIESFQECFQNCTSLEEITLFEADINFLMNYYSNGAKNAFNGCTSLTKIGVPSDLAEETDWHAFRLKFGASTVEGKVFDKTGTATNITQTAVTKSTLKLPIKTDELWFPSGYTDEQIDAIIQKVIQYRYTYWNKDVLSPDQKNFVLWADDPSHVKSNLPSLNVVNAVTSGDMHPVTSNAVAQIAPVDTVASGNLHSVTSNAVANMNNLNLPVFVGDDVFARAESCPLNRVTFFRVFESTANSPYISGGNDFWYYVNRLEIDTYIRIVAFDIRSDKIYTNSKVNGTWGSWKVQSCIISVHVTITTDGLGNGFTGYSTSSEYIPISFRPTNDNSPTIISCDSSGNYWLKPFGWGDFVIRPNLTLEGDLILQRQK